MVHAHRLSVAAIVACLVPASCLAQSVCLPAPRLLTTTPMGGQAGTQFVVSIGGEHLDEVDELLFSQPGIVAVPHRDADGQPVENQFDVSIAEDCPAGIHEARVMSRLGISSSRVFSVGSLPEVTRQQANTSLAKAMPLSINTICNAATTRQAVDYYSFDALRGQRFVIDCAARGIDSKLKPVLILADAAGNDLQAERRGGALDFSAPQDGTWIVKVHDLTYNGGAPYFYRLAIQQTAENTKIARLPATARVSSFSWPPAQYHPETVIAEAEPNHDTPQSITLPCDINGAFYPAADVDVFEFEARRGEEWWVEVASERLGRPTDPAIVVQHVGPEGTLTDVAELHDIASPIKVSSNGYSYDGPPYHAGSTDIIGRITIQQDGTHRLRITDLFGGTRSDPANIYYLVIRKPQPDFAIVGWALHMQLRNGDRNALSKPIALRGGSTMAFEVVTVRRDGFTGPIELSMENLPEGVTARGLTIPAGATRGMILLTAAEDAPRGLSIARFFGTAEIDGTSVTREGRFASMAWPVPDASREIPSPRLLADIPVSVSGSEQAPMTVAAAEDRVWEVTEGEALTLPVVRKVRSQFSGPSISFRTFGAGFERQPAFTAPLSEGTSDVTIDLAKLKIPAGEHTIAFYGTAVARYEYFPESVATAEQTLQQSRKRLQQLKDQAAASQGAASAASQPAGTSTADRIKAAEAAVRQAEQQLKDFTTRARPKDIADIVVSTPVRIRVSPRAEDAAE
jgi:hypothetical protein